MDGLVVVEGVADDLDAVLPDDDLVHVGAVAAEVACELHDLRGGLDPVGGPHEPDPRGAPQDAEDLLCGGLGGELGDDGLHVHQGGGCLHGHGVDVEPGHDALNVRTVVRRELDGGLQPVDGAALAVARIDGAPDDGDERVLDPERLVYGIQGPEEGGRVA